MYSRVADKVSPRWYIHLDQCAGCAWNRCNCAHRSSSAEYPNHRTRRHQAQWIPAVTTCHHSVCRHLPHQTIERGFKHVQTVVKHGKTFRGSMPSQYWSPIQYSTGFSYWGMSYWGLSDQGRLLSSPPTCWCIGNDALGLKFTTVVALATSPPTLHDMSTCPLDADKAWPQLPQLKQLNRTQPTSTAQNPAICGANLPAYSERKLNTGGVHSFFVYFVLRSQENDGFEADQ